MNSVKSLTRVLAMTATSLFLISLTFWAASYATIRLYVVQSKSPLLVMTAHRGTFFLQQVFEERWQSKQQPPGRHYYWRMGTDAYPPLPGVGAPESEPIFSRSARPSKDVEVAKRRPGARQNPTRFYVDWTVSGWRSVSTLAGCSALFWMLAAFLDGRLLGRQMLGSLGLAACFVALANWYSDLLRWVLTNLGAIGVLVIVAFWLLFLISQRRWELEARIRLTWVGFALSSTVAFFLCFTLFWSIEREEIDLFGPSSNEQYAHGAYVLSRGPVGGYSDAFLGGEGWSIRRLRFGLPALMPFAPRFGTFGGTYYAMPLWIPLAALAIPTGIMFITNRRSRRKTKRQTGDAVDG